VIGKSNWPKPANRCSFGIKRSHWLPGRRERHDAKPIYSRLTPVPEGRPTGNEAALKTARSFPKSAGSLAHGRISRHINARRHHRPPCLVASFLVSTPSRGNGKRTDGMPEPFPRRFSVESRGVFPLPISQGEPAGVSFVSGLSPETTRSKLRDSDTRPETVRHPAG
jgi:hypothetical protein